MSRGGRPSERTKRGPHKRNLVGPHEALRSIERAGGVPDEVIEDLSGSTRSAAAKKAGDYMQTFTENTLESAKFLGGMQASVGDDANRRMAWAMSVTNSMGQSVPMKKRCRHIRAADPNVTEIRTIAHLGAGVWGCLECVKQAGPSALQKNLWPNECDLCGAQSERFSELAGTFSGCFVNGSICARCASFLSVDEPSTKTQAGR